MAARRNEAYPENAPGDFYVVRDECIFCGAPHVMAPDLIAWAHDFSGQPHHCYFKKQPETEAEIDRAVKACSANCCGSYRYAGSDKQIERKLRKAGCGGAIEDH
jgi:hypothetical protein